MRGPAAASHHGLTLERTLNWLGATSQIAPPFAGNRAESLAIFGAVQLFMAFPAVNKLAGVRRPVSSVLYGSCSVCG
jgi:hypothetical protein